jgi:hypothetical protein
MRDQVRSYYYHMGREAIASHEASLMSCRPYNHTFCEVTFHTLDLNSSYARVPSAEFLFVMFNPP